MIWNIIKKNIYIIITGLNLLKYATTLTNATSTMPSTQHSNNTDNATMNKNCVTFANKKLGTILQSYDITAIHDLAPRRDGTRTIIVQLLSAEKKATLMNKRGSLRCTSIYLNDHMSASNSEMFHQTRQLKRDWKIHAAWTISSSGVVRVTPRCKSDKSLILSDGRHKHW